MIITLWPDQIFTNVHQVAKNPGNATHLIRRKTKEGKAKRNRRSQRGSPGELSLDPSIATLDKRTEEKEVFETFQLKPTERG